MDAKQDALLQEIKMGLQRHINLLKDSNKVKRRRAIQHIGRVLEELCEKADTNKDDEVVVRTLYMNVLSRSIGACVKDVSEKPREIAATLAARALPFLNLEDAKNGHPVFSQLLESLHHQVGTLPLKEPSEELRLMQLKLATEMANKAKIYAKENLDKLVSISVACCHDTYPQVKIAVGKLASLVSRLAMEEGSLTATKCGEVIEQLGKALLPNLKHQRHKVRSATLEGLSGVVLARGRADNWFKEALPTIAKLVHDRTPGVRVEFVSTMHKWLGSLVLEKTERVHMLLLVLAGLSDEHQPSREIAMKCLSQLGAESKFVSAESKPNDSKQATPMNAETSIKSETATNWCDKDTALPFEGPPCPSACRLICAYLKDLVPPILNQLSHWTTDGRSKAAGMLHSLVVMTQGSLLPHLEQVLLHLPKHVKDIEDVAYPMVKRSLQAIGHFLPCDSWLDVVISNLKLSAEGGHSAWLVMLNHLLEGSTPHQIIKRVERLSNVLSDAALCLSDHMPTRFFTRATLSTILGAFKSTNTTLRDNHGNTGDAKEANESKFSARNQVFYALIELHSQCETNKEFESVEAVMQLLGDISIPNNSQNSKNSLAAIYNSEFMVAIKRILGKALHDPKVVDWTEETPQTKLLVTLLKRSARVIHNYLKIVVPIMVESCDSVENSPAVRINMLSLLHQMVMGSDTSAWTAYLTHIVQNIILPNMVWRNGGTAETIRVAAIKILVHILESSPSSHEIVANLLVTRLETLETCLDEDEVRVRLGMATIFRHVLTHKPKDLDEFKLSKLYPKLMDRLDDSEDSVRIQMASTLSALVTKAFPAAKSFDSTGQAFTYIIKHTLIHLDDQNEEVKRAMFNFLKDAAPYNPKVFSELVTAARSRHSTPELCNALLKNLSTESKERSDSTAQVD